LSLNSEPIIGNHPDKRNQNYLSGVFLGLVAGNGMTVRCIWLY